MIRIFLVVSFFTVYFFPSNGQNNLCSQEFKVWNSISGQFDTLTRFDYFYDSNNNLREFRTSLWESINGNYVYTSKGEFTYSGNSGPDYVLNHTYDPINGLWLNESEIFLDYDINGNLTKDSIRDYDAQSMSWLPYYRFREFYYYNTNNFYNAHILQDWVSGNWMNTDSISRLSDTLGLAIEYNTSIWNTGLSTWENDFKIMLSYQGTLVSDSVIQTWNGSNYINTYKYHSDYLGNGKIFTKSGYAWDAGINNWNLTEVDTSFYDLNNNLIQDNYYYQDNNQWSPVWIIQYTYGNCVYAGISELRTVERMLAFPNPVSSFLTFSFPSIVTNGMFRIINLNGQVLYEMESIYGNSINIDVSIYPEAIYIAELLNTNYTLRIKFVKN